MLEYSSISVSSYDAASLADRLTERSAQGWDLVAIVPAGTNVTAYLSRATEATPDHSEVRAEDRAEHNPAPALAAQTTDASSEPSEVVEPAGWAAEPEPHTDLAPEPEPEPQPESQPAAATDAAAPAGWYADPAGRYELRYWDGAQWTEHVSRAGAQYTDPPVA